MDRRTFMKAAALAPTAIGGLMADYAESAPSVHRAYPVHWGPMISTFASQAEKAYGIGAGPVNQRVG